MYTNNGSYTSHTLAFGMFWMEVGHVAIIAGMPLSSNNPSTFEGVNVSYQDGTAHAFRRRLSTARKNSVTEKVDAFAHKYMWEKIADWPAQLVGYLYRSSTTSDYHTAWMWDRGITKWIWLEKTSRKNPHLLDFRNRILRTTTWSWVMSVLVPTLWLTVLPAFFGGMVR